MKLGGSLGTRVADNFRIYQGEWSLNVPANVHRERCSGWFYRWSRRANRLVASFDHRIYQRLNPQVLTNDALDEIGFTVVHSLSLPLCSRDIGQRVNAERFPGVRKTLQDFHDHQIFRLCQRSKRRARNWRKQSGGCVGGSVDSENRDVASNIIGYIEKFS